MTVLGFDTSNYTTSIAAFDGTSGENQSRLLPVKAGELGLRQADALFAHVKSLPDLAGGLFSHVDPQSVAAVGVSTRPRAVDGSYMPCFLAGVCLAKTVASLLRVPLVEVSHQQGHLAAALWSSGREALLDRPFLAWHLSGGTTELLYVSPRGGTWLAAGSAAPQTFLPVSSSTGRPAAGLRLPGRARPGPAEPGGRAVEGFRVKCPELEFSLSGVENQVQQYFTRTGSREKTAAFALDSVCRAVYAATDHARRRHPGLPVVFSGGVASNAMLRRQMEPFDPVFCPPQYATDNAMGVAVLAWRSLEESDGTTDL
ncbi:MAG: DNA-binding protein [Oscillospiraceae bacterium]